MTKPADMVPPGFLREAYHRNLPESAASAVDLLFALRGCLQRINADLSHWLGADAVSPGRMQLLMILWARREPVRQADLPALLHVSRPSVSELVDALERDGLVERHRDERHSLRFKITLTAAGRINTEALLRENTSRLGVTFADLSVDARKDLSETLDGIARSSPLHPGTTNL